MKTFLTFTLEDTQRKAITEHCKKTDISISQFLRDSAMQRLGNDS